MAANSLPVKLKNAFTKLSIYNVPLTTVPEAPEGVKNGLTIHGVPPFEKGIPSSYYL
jgi:hypothetical protein